jgi:TusA-related sulfurtransferase/predicted peroxiredoxin
LIVPIETLPKVGREPTVAPPPHRVMEGARRELDVRGRTISTAIVWAVREQLAELEVGDEIDLETDPFPAIVPDLEAWCRRTGHEFVDLRRNGESWRVRLRKGEPRRNEHRVAVVITTDDLTELLSPLGFALAAALGGAQVSVYLLGPAVHLLAPGFRARLHGPARPFSRFARAGLERAGHVAPAEKLRQLQALGGALYACGPSLQHFRVDPDRLAFDDVVVCEYLTFMEVMQLADVELYS